MSLARRTAINSAANVADQIVSGLYLLVSYGILAREAGLRDVALLSLALLIGNAAQTSNISLGTGLNRYLPNFAGKGDDAAIIAYLQTALLVTTIFFAILGIAAYWPFAQLLATLVDADMTAAAATMVLPAILFAIFQNVAAVTQSGLGALQMGFERSAISAATQLLGLALTIALVPEYGALAALWVRVVHTAILVLVGWLWLVRHVPNLPIVPMKIDVGIARNLLAVGVNMQLMSICTMLLEPASRILIGWYGTMEQVAIFALAWRLVQQIRGTLFYASSAILPVFGFVGATDENESVRIYRLVNAITGFAVIPSLLGTIAIAPAVGSLWLETETMDFSLYVALFTLGFLPSTIALTSYQWSLGMGQFRVNLIGHIAMAAINLVAGWGLSLFLGGLGVAIGTGLALFFSGFYMAIGNQKLIVQADHGYDLRNDVALLFAGSGAILACWWLAFERDLLSAPLSLLSLSFVISAILMGPFAWRHSARQIIWNFWKSTRRSGTA